MDIEQPETIPDFPVRGAVGWPRPPATVTIGQFYAALDAFLATLDPRRLEPIATRSTTTSSSPASCSRSTIMPTRIAPSTNRLRGRRRRGRSARFPERARPFLPLRRGLSRQGADQDPATPAMRGARSRSASTGTRSIRPSPIRHARFLADPPAAQAAQAACNAAYSADGRRAAAGRDRRPGALGIAVRAMFDLRMAAQVALPRRSPTALGRRPRFPLLAQQPGASA